MNLDIYEAKTLTFTLGEGIEISLETGMLAKQANGSVILRQGDNVILATCCYSKQPKEGIDFFPLTVDFEERLYSVGQIPSSYTRREGKPIDKAILVSRLIDRPIRPTFPKGFYNDVQVVVTPMSYDRSISIEPLAILAASTAVTLAGLPTVSPIASVKVGLIKGKFILNPSIEELEESLFELVVAGNEDNVLMIEAGANFVSEEILLSAIDFAQPFIKQQVLKQKELAEMCGIQKMEFVPPEEDSILKELVSGLCKDKLVEAIESSLDKKRREDMVEEAFALVSAHFDSIQDDNEKKAKKEKALAYARGLEKSIMRGQIMGKGVRVDGRKCNEIRPIWCKSSFLPRAHGSAIFTRGSTQVCSVVTLGGNSDSKPVQGIWHEEELNYFHNYNFPPYSVGEARSMRSPGRREIGHGALAERAIIPSLPAKTEFPYTIRVVSDVLGSNGSTSMASTCGSSLALMDAGVPVKCIVGGIAMGLILEKNQCAVLSDIQGVEDFLGDMDFKVTGSKDGVTAIQLDLKLPEGIDLKILKIALQQALEGRKHIIEQIEKELKTHRPELSQFAPYMGTMNIDPSDIGALIGSGGKTIKKLIEQSSVEKIDVTDEGLVTVLGSKDTVPGAIERIKSLLMKIEPGAEYIGTVVRKMDIGIMVELAPGKTGLYKISPNYAEAEKVFAKYNVGDRVEVLIRDVDQKGRINIQAMRPCAEK